MNGIQYTATFGNGVTATIALEDAPYRRGTAANGGLLYDRADAHQRPDCDGVRDGVDGRRSLPGHRRQHPGQPGLGHGLLGRAGDPEVPELLRRHGRHLGSPGSEWGYAVTGGLNLKLPQLGAGDQLWVEATYTKGILGRLTGASNPQTIGVYGSSSIAYQSLAFGYLLDGVFDCRPRARTSSWI